MIKICYIIGQLSKGGGERQLFELVKGINYDKFDPLVISLSQGGYWCKEIQKLGIQVVELRRRRHKEVTRLFKLINLLKAIKPDIVHTYLHSANVYGRIAAILNKVPVIIASERSLPEIGKNETFLGICLAKLLAIFSSAIICNSYMASETYIKRYSFDKKKVFTVHNGINGTEFLKEIGLNNQKKLAESVVCTVGRLSPPKNHQLFLEMAKMVLDIYQNRNLKFVIAGGGPLRDELVGYSNHLGIEKYLLFTGEREDIPSLLQNTDVFVMTSVYEGLSNSIMEAMLAELPVVATDVGGNKELVIDGQTGFLCPANDPSVLTKKVIHLIENKQEAGGMGKNGKEVIMKEFKIERMIKETENIYYELLSA